MQLPPAELSINPWTSSKPKHSCERGKILNWLAHKTDQKNEPESLHREKCIFYIMKWTIFRTIFVHLNDSDQMTKKNQMYSYELQVPWQIYLIEEDVSKWNKERILFFTKDLCLFNDWTNCHHNWDPIYFLFHIVCLQYCISTVCPSHKGNYQIKFYLIIYKFNIIFFILCMNIYWPLNDIFLIFLVLLHISIVHLNKA